MGTIIKRDEITLISHNSVYQPREDSYLVVGNLSKFILKNSPKHIIEIGSGSGVISLHALKKESSHQYYAVDINFDAILLTLTNMKHNNLDNLHVICTDLMSCFREGTKFEMVIFNPPYLPPNEFDKHLTSKEKQALVGGKTGIETTIRLIENSSSITNRIVVIVSSLTTSIEKFQEVVFPWNCEVIAKLPLDFEKLWLIVLSKEVQI